ncbi:MAG: PKD domain-containing protein [Thermoplasmata archaeon]
MSRPWALVAIVGLVTILILGGLAAPSSGNPVRASTEPALSSAAPKAPVEAAAGPALSEAMVDAAVSSLDHGGGPTRGLSANCAVTGGGEATCGRTPVDPTEQTGGAGIVSTPPSAFSTTTPQWFDVALNVTNESGGQVPSVAYSGRMAYDPVLSEMVLFDGCSDAACPSNDTWTYDGISWTNITNHRLPTPSAREGAGLDYDPAFGGVVLFGGSNPDLGLSYGDTWLFTSAGWTNISAKVGYPQKVGGGNVAWSYGAMAFDPALDTMVVVDGCADAACDMIWNSTWFLRTSGWTLTVGPGPTADPTSLAYTSAAYDAADNDLVLFGGYDPVAATGSNYTFLLTPTRTWVNITDEDAGCVASVCYTPPGRISDAMTWDSQLDAIFMTDGLNETSNLRLNDSWIFSGGVWLPANLTAPTAPSGYCPVTQPAMPEESSNVTPLIIGGSAQDGTPCLTAAGTMEWVYEVAPQLNVTTSSVHIDLGRASNFTASWTVGTGSGVVAGWNVSFGDGQYDTPARGPTGENTSSAYLQNFSHTYGVTGTFSANVTWSDFYYIAGTTSPPSVTVYPQLTATITASTTSIKVGGSVTFTTKPSGGDAPFEYAWSFGDGTTSTAPAPPAHTYSKSGVYAVNLTVTDSTGQPVRSSVIVTVSGPTAPGFVPLTTDLSLLVAFAFVIVAALLAVVVRGRRKKSVRAPPA